MSVRIIIPTNPKRKDKFDRLMNSLEGMAHEAHNVIINDPVGDMGFTHAVNEGIKLAFEFPSDYIWLLNDDTTVFKDTLIESHKFMEEHPRCGIMGMMNLQMENPDYIIWGGSGSPFPAGQHRRGNRSLHELEEPTRERWVTFSSAFMRMEMVRELGILDPGMVWVYSDSDYSYRARYYGWECWYNPKAKILHEGGVSGKPPKRLLNRFMVDQINFANKWINNKLWIDLDSELFI